MKQYLIFRVIFDKNVRIILTKNDVRSIEDELYRGITPKRIRYFLLGIHVEGGTVKAVENALYSKSIAQSVPEIRGSKV